MQRLAHVLDTPPPAPDAGRGPLGDAVVGDPAFAHIIGHSAALRHVFEQVRLVASTDSTVLITGETGTGKELIARALHQASARRERPLVAVNCAALSPHLVESELFGHEAGAFTGAVGRRIGRFEQAHGGTIFLDEVGELSPDVQVKLLRVLQERECDRVGGTTPVHLDVRVCAATHRNLATMVREGAFREDLYYRLNVFPVELPALRERPDDIPLLAQHMLDRFTRASGVPRKTVPPSMLARLRAYAWPGNVRELQSVIERAAILSAGTTLHIDDETLPAAHARHAAADRTMTLADNEREHILRMLAETGGVIEGPNGAARILGIHASTLRSRMRKRGIVAHSRATAAAVIYDGTREMARAE